MDEAVAILARTPSTLDALLRDLPHDWVTANEGGSTWSPDDVVGHLIHGERTDWVPRNPRKIDGPAQLREILLMAA